MKGETTKEEHNEYLKKLALEIALHGVRNTHLESLHAGEQGGGAGGGFNNKEMKKLMIEVVNKIYTILVNELDKQVIPDKIDNLMSASLRTLDWNEPKLDKSLTFKE